MLQLKQYPGFWDNELCYFTIKPNSMYVMIPDDLTTDSVRFNMTDMGDFTIRALSTKTFFLSYTVGEEDDTNRWYFGIKRQEHKITNLPINTCIESIYITNNRPDVVMVYKECKLKTSITRTSTDAYTLSIIVYSDYDAFYADGFSSPEFKLVIKYYDPS